MSVYVDDARNPFGRMIMCHMRADDLDELHAMAVKVGVSRTHFQPDVDHPHYDICITKRQKAVDLGAIPMTTIEMIRHFRKAKAFQ